MHSLPLEDGQAWRVELREPCLSSEYAESGLGELVLRLHYVCIYIYIYGIFVLALDFTLGIFGIGFPADVSANLTARACGTLKPQKCKPQNLIHDSSTSLAGAEAAVQAAPIGMFSCRICSFGFSGMLAVWVELCETEKARNPPKMRSSVESDCFMPGASSPLSATTSSPTSMWEPMARDEGLTKKVFRTRSAGSGFKVWICKAASFKLFRANQ